MNRPARSEIDALHQALDQTRAVIASAHQVLDEAGVPPATGTPCDHPRCTSLLVHRIRALIAQYEANPAPVRDLPESEKE